jgi:hypothetical protein
MTNPVFQAQNPAISGYSLGWSSCSAFSGAMAASYDRQVLKLMSGGALRQMTGDTSGGLTLAQIDSALLAGWNVDLEVRYRLDWATFAKRINAGQAAVLQLWYAPIAATRFDAGGGFTGNHAVTVLPGWIVMDPLADGRRDGIYKYHGEAYPQTLLKTAAGKLNLGGYGYNPLGYGLVYAAFTRDNTRTYQLNWVGGNFYRYFLNADKTAITKRSAVLQVGAYGPSPVSAPRLFSWPGNTSRSLVQVLDGKFQGIWIAIPQSQLRLVEVP